MIRTVSSILLALDTSTRRIGLAIYNGTEVLGETVWTSHDHHTVELAPAVANALARCGVAVADLGALGVAIGPGSFTGLRIGLALAKGISMARRLPIIGVSTLDALAAAQPVQDIPLAAVLRAGRGRLAVGWYKAKKSGWQAVQPLQVLTAQDLVQNIQKPTIVCGELTGAERHLLAAERKSIILASPALSLRRPAFLAELAWRRWQAGKIDDPATLAPIYLHFNEAIPA